MKINKMLSFRISEDELHHILADHVYEQTSNEAYRVHILENHYDFEFVDSEWILSVDGELSDE